MQYSLKQCYQLLGVDNRQLDKLLAIASISKEMLVTPSNDRRVRLLSQEQLDQLRLIQASQTLTKEHRALFNEAPDLVAEIQQLRERITVLEAKKAAYTSSNYPARYQNDLEVTQPHSDTTSITSTSRTQPSRPQKRSSTHQNEGIQRNQDGEYHFGEDGLTYSAEGLLTDRGFARIAEEHGAKFETARQSWARSIPDSMRSSRTSAVQWILTNRRKYVLSRCNQPDCPCHSNQPTEENITE